MAINPALFTLLGIYNGPWTPFVVNPLAPVVNGTGPVNGVGGNDEIIVGNLNLTVFGNGGDDYIDSRNAGVVNVLNGGGGSDQIFGGSGANTINGGPGNDYIEGGPGIDVLNGGLGIDTLSYESAEPVRGTSTGVTVTLNASGGGTVSGGANVNVDVITGGFENIVGSNFNDTLTGNTGNNILIGLAGNDFLFGREGDDTLVGGAGADTFTGGVGIDTADYSTSPGGVNVDLSTASGSGSDAQGDTLSTIENVTGSAFSDVITGDTGNNVLVGGAGNDTLNGGDGDDMLIGGAGGDTIIPGDGDEDRIIYNSVLDAPAGPSPESINYKSSGAFLIDLSAIDANSNTVGSNETFAWVDSFTGVAGQLLIAKDPLGLPLPEVYGDVNGDGNADLAIAFISGGLIDTPPPQDFFIL